MDAGSNYVSASGSGQLFVTSVMQLCHFCKQLLFVSQREVRKCRANCGCYRTADFSGHSTVLKINVYLSKADQTELFKNSLTSYLTDV